VRFDIPSEVGRAVEKRPQIRLSFAKHLGEHPDLIRLAETRVDEALTGRPQVESTHLLLAARGSRDPLVKGQILRLSAQRGERNDQFTTTACFLSMASPTLEQGLAMATAKRPSRVVVQPHLLLPGKLSLSLADKVAAIAERVPQVEWVSCEPLGPAPCLAQFALDLAWDAYQTT